MITLGQIVEQKDGYIIIPMDKGWKLNAGDEDLRVMDQTMGPNVYALWSDSDQSIVAMVFDKGTWSKKTASAYVKEAKAKGDKVTEDIDATSFSDIRVTVRKALEAILIPEPQPSQDQDAPVAYGDAYPWIEDIGPARVVFTYRDTTYAAPYTILEDGVAIGEVSEVTQGWVKSDGSIITLSESALYGFWGSLGDAEDVAEGDNLIWKEILHPGKWFKTNSGKEIEVSSHIVQEAYRAFTDGYPRYISVPSDHHWIGNRGVVPPEHNRGFVRELKLNGDKLYAGFMFTNKDTEAGVLDGSIADVSAYLQPNVTHNATGVHYDWALRHVLLTNNPLVSDLAEWGVIAADDTDPVSGRRILNYVQVANEEGTMADRFVAGSAGVEGAPDDNGSLMLTGEAATEYAYLQDRGFTSAELMALSEQGARLEAMGLSINDLVAQAMKLREGARDMEISRVIAAMEGTGEHTGVTVIEGRRHYPVVIEAVTAALTYGASDMALSGDESGVTPLDSVVLGIINAIPESGRLPIAADAKGARHDGKEKLDLDENDPESSGKKPTAEQIDSFIAEIG